MNPISVVAIFCQDVRDEAGGLHSIMGIMPDNVEGQSDAKETEGAAPVIPRLCIYSRLHFDPRDKLGEVTSKLVFPNGQERLVNMFEPDVIKTARAQSIEQGSPIVGIISRLEMANFPVLANGRLQLIVTVRGIDYLAGALNLKISNPSSTELPQPSSRSRRAARKTAHPRAPSRP